MTLIYDAMLFARRAHANHTRKYTGNPYVEHLAEVAGIVASVPMDPHIKEVSVATAWLHDCVEDQQICPEDLKLRFGPVVAEGVLLLSDLEEGNRATRKALSRQRLSMAHHWVQTIKVADMISNTESIVTHDPKFARVYLEEKVLLLDVLTKANGPLVELAREITLTAKKQLKGNS